MNAIFNTFFLVLIIILHSATINAFPTVYPTGTTIYDPQKTFEGYTIYNPENQNVVSEILMIDMLGNIVHTWSHSKYKLVYAEPLSDGNLLLSYKVESGEDRGGWLN